MSNSNSPFGLKQIGVVTGPDNTIQVRKYYVPSTDGTAIYVNDAVVNTGSADTTNNTYLPICTASTVNTDLVCGVCVGVDQVDHVADSSLVLGRVHRPASTGMYIWVCVDPNAVYLVQSDGAATTDMMGNTNIVYTTAGSSVTGISGMQASHTVTTTNTLQLKILQASQIVGNDPTSSNALLEVMLNQTAMRAGTTGV